MSSFLPLPLSYQWLAPLFPTLSRISLLLDLISVLRDLGDICVLVFGATVGNIAEISALVTASLS